MPALFWEMGRAGQGWKVRMSREGEVGWDAQGSRKIPLPRLNVVMEPHEGRPGADAFLELLYWG